MLEILYDHYKETCSITAEVIKRRDKLIIYVVLTTTLLVLQGVLPEVSSETLSNILSHQFGVTTSIDLSVIGSLLWFVLLLLLLRYFQSSMFVERQYPYIHKLEEEIGGGVLAREGKAYLEKYPIFSNWMWLLYTIVFPVLLFSIVLAKIISEITYACINGWSYTTHLNIVIALLIIISISLYLFSLHSKEK
jgi:hypothetical protein